VVGRTRRRPPHAKNGRRFCHRPSPASAVTPLVWPCSQATPKPSNDLLCTGQGRKDPVRISRLSKSLRRPPPLAADVVRRLSPDSTRPRPSLDRASTRMSHLHLHDNAISFPDATHATTSHKPTARACRMCRRPRRCVRRTGRFEQCTGDPTQPPANRCPTPLLLHTTPSGAIDRFTTGDISPRSLAPCRRRRLRALTGTRSSTSSPPPVGSSTG
jgi:hypothetical protein